MSIDLLEGPETKTHTPDIRCQWRGSHDGIVWISWRDLPHPEAMVPAFDDNGDQFSFGQARLLQDGVETRRTPIFTWLKTQ